MQYKLYILLISFWIINGWTFAQENSHETRYLVLYFEGLVGWEKNLEVAGNPSEISLIIFNRSQDLENGLKKFDPHKNMRANITGFLKSKGTLSPSYLTQNQGLCMDSKSIAESESKIVTAVNIDSIFCNGDYFVSAFIPNDEEYFRYIYIGVVELKATFIKCKYCLELDGYRDLIEKDTVSFVTAFDKSSIVNKVEIAMHFLDANRNKGPRWFYSPTIKSARTFNFFQNLEK